MAARQAMSLFFCQRFFAILFLARFRLSRELRISTNVGRPFRNMMARKDDGKKMAARQAMSLLF